MPTDHRRLKSERAGLRRLKREGTVAVGQSACDFVPKRVCKENEGTRDRGLCGALQHSPNDHLGVAC